MHKLVFSFDEFLSLINLISRYSEMRGFYLDFHSDNCFLAISDDDLHFFPPISLDDYIVHDKEV